MQEARAQWDIASFNLFATLNALFLFATFHGEENNFNEIGIQGKIEGPEIGASVTDLHSASV